MPNDTAYYAKPLPDAVKLASGEVRGEFFGSDASRRTALSPASRPDRSGSGRPQRS